MCDRLPETPEERADRELRLALDEAFRLELDPPADPMELSRRRFNLSTFIQTHLLRRSV